MAIINGDVIFSRGGKPVQVTSKDVQTGNVTLEPDFDKVQKESEYGIKNGLGKEVKEAFKATLSEVKDSNKIVEIENLRKKVAALKKENVDPRLMRYLEGELQYRMTRERYTPLDFEFDPLTATSS